MKLILSGRAKRKVEKDNDKRRKKRIIELLNFIQDKVEDVYANGTQKAIDRYIKEIEK